MNVQSVLQSPQFAITLTLAAYLLGQWLYKRLGYSSLVQPVVSGIALVMLVLWLTGLDYHYYFAGAGIIHFLLGTATVALALPLYHHLRLIRSHLKPLLITLLVSGLVASGSAVGLAWLAGGSDSLLRTLAPKSITTPFAIPVAEALGGYPALAATVVIATGILVAALGTPVLRLLRVDHPVAQGAALGMIGHGVGTARAFQLGPDVGAFAALSMGLMGLYTALGLGLLGL
ncbi:MAG: LrgB family protein [Halomonadaceae bacterium]|nr:MAG: LrgB family protein [Halomonadaceae bacterium]